MAAKCTKCGNESNYNFALNIGLCNTCISARLEDLKAENEKYKTALERIRDLETECCPRCEGSGNLYADGKAHYMSESAPTILCGNCGGSGRILPEDAQQIAADVFGASNSAPDKEESVYSMRQTLKEKP